MQCPHYRGMATVIVIEKISYGSKFEYNSKHAIPDILSYLGIFSENPDKERIIREEIDATLTKMRVITYGECKKTGEGKLALCLGVYCETDYEARKQLEPYLPMLLRLFRQRQEKNKSPYLRLFRSIPTVDEKPLRTHFATGEIIPELSIFDKKTPKKPSITDPLDIENLYNTFNDGISKLNDQEEIRIKKEHFPFSSGIKDTIKKHRFSNEGPIINKETDNEVPKSVEELIRKLEKKGRGNNLF